MSDVSVSDVSVSVSVASVSVSVAEPADESAESEPRSGTPEASSTCSESGPGVSRRPEAASLPARAAVSGPLSTGPDASGPLSGSPEPSMGLSAPSVSGSVSSAGEVSSSGTVSAGGLSSGGDSTSVSGRTTSVSGRTTSVSGPTWVSAAGVLLSVDGHPSVSAQTHGHRLTARARPRCPMVLLHRPLRRPIYPAWAVERSPARRRPPLTDRSTAQSAAARRPSKPCDPHRRTPRPPSSEFRVARIP